MDSFSCLTSIEPMLDPIFAQSRCTFSYVHILHTTIGLMIKIGLNGKRV